MPTVGSWKGADKKAKFSGLVGRIEVAGGIRRGSIVAYRPPGLDGLLAPRSCSVGIEIYELTFIVVPLPTFKAFPGMVGSVLWVAQGGIPSLIFVLY